MELPTRLTYNDRDVPIATLPPVSFLVVLLAVIGYVLCDDAATGSSTDMHQATQISPWVGYVYLAVVGVGGAAAGGAADRDPAAHSGRTRGRSRRTASGGT